MRRWGQGPSQNLAAIRAERRATSGPSTRLALSRSLFASTIQMSSGKKIALAVFVLIPALCRLGGVLLLWNVDSSYSTQLEVQKAAARSIAMPLDVSDLHLPAVPDAENAADTYLTTSILVDGPLSAQVKAVQSGLGAARPEAVQKADAALPDLKPVFNDLQALAARPKCDFHHDLNQGFNLLFPELANMKTLAKLECFRFK